MKKWIVVCAIAFALAAISPVAQILSPEPEMQAVNWNSKPNGGG